MDKIVASSVLDMYKTIFEDLTGQYVTRISLEQWSVRIMFVKCSELIVECDWRLTDESGNEMDNSVKLGIRKRFELWRIVGSTATHFEIDPENICAWSIQTSSGMKLTIIGDLDKFEDWSIVFPNHEGMFVSSGGQITKW